jgi:L-malate glycosyltransferase
MTVGIVGNQESVHVQRWSNALAERGHRVVPIDLSGRGRSPAGRIAAYARLRAALQRVASTEHSLVAVHSVPDGVLATGLRGVHPIVLSAWGHDVTAEPTGPLGWTRSRQQRGLFRAADAVTATSEFLADAVRRRFAVEATVIPFGIDVDRFRPRSGPRRPGPIRIGFVKWGLEPKYGPDVLLEGLGRLNSDESFEAIVAGEGSLGADLRDRARALGIADRVRFIGRRPHGEVAALLSDLDIFVMPSRREEWGVAAAEASAAGLPIVATRVGGIPEIVVDGRTGLLVSPEDPVSLAAALSRLVRDPALRDRLGAEGRRKVEAEFRWEGCVDLMEHVYADVLAAREGRPERG